MGQGRGDRQGVRDDEACTMGAGAVLALFGLGMLAGALVTLLTTPEPGESVRRRVKRGVETARHEFDETVGQAEESWKAVGEGAREAIRKTTTRIKEATQVTKEALTKDEPSN
ncbi:MAG: YtxH domain-containing protein [Nitrospirota bacterium]